ncbi:MAG: polysaccharide deacetylase family protein [Bacteroidales bacterium]|jgi:peptidoglycan/xylan/chitin deacetylase (PgdA/CDA1 family)|nr:polysaccharide deacetylase family protein [Bacteroidales bacterium]
MVNLMYHDISVEYDMSSGFQTRVSMDYKVDKINFEEQVKNCKRKDVVFTFDDGGVSFLTVAAPILEKYGYKGVFFISTKYIGTPGFLTERQLIELDRRGHIIGSHTHSHPKNLSLLSSDEIFNEWKESIELLSHILNKRVYVASIPNGRGSKIVTETAQKAGIKVLYTSEPTTKIVNKAGITLLGRYVVRRSFSNKTVMNIVNSSLSRFKLKLKWSLINIVKVILGKYYYNLRKALTTR